MLFTSSVPRKCVAVAHLRPTSMSFSVVQDFAAANQRNFDSLEPVHFGSPWPGKIDSTPSR